MVHDNKKPLPALTSLRFAAALAIMVHHCNGVFWKAAELGPLDVGVSFFFVLSGFILTYVYRDIEPTRARFAGFYRARLARIWPLHLSCLLMTIVLIAVPEPFDLRVLAANALLLHAWIPLDRYFFSYNYVSWTISTELFFYLIFPFMMVHARRWLNRTLLLAAVTVVALALTSYWAHLLPWETTHDHLSSTGLLYTNPLARVGEFLFGIATGMIFLDERAVADQTVEDRRQRLLWSAAELGSIALFVLGYRFLLSYYAPAIHQIMLSAGATSVPLTGIAGESALLPQLSPFGSLIVNEWANHVGLTPFAVLLIYVLAHQRGVVSRALSHPALVFLGETSFALYLVHQIMLRFVQQQGWRTDGVGFALYLGCALLVAASLHLLLEKPARALLAGRRVR
ncbi:MAG: acyltransferase [Herminiimonas sp.]|nr:acyltransferase [Herminiimonas sp.]